MIRGLHHRGGFLVSVATLLVTASLWELVSRITHVSFLPSLVDIVQRLVTLTSDSVFEANLRSTSTNFVIGFGIAVVVGSATGIMMGLSSKVNAALSIYVYALLAAPSIAFAPVFFGIWGIGSESVIAIIVMSSMFYIIINTATAIEAAPPELLDMATSFGASRRDALLRIVLPAATPLIMAGMRYAIARAIKGSVTGEMFVAVTGIGAILMQAGQGFHATTVLAIILLIIVVAYAAMEVVMFIDRRLTAWLPSNERVGGY